MASETVEVNFGAVLSAKKGDSLLMFPMPPPAEPMAESCGLWFVEMRRELWFVEKQKAELGSPASCGYVYGD